MMRVMPPDGTDRLRDAIRAERGLVLVLTGAGISLASGISTFRGEDPGAIWKHDVMERATLRFFEQDPAASWLWYRQRFATILQAAPNPAHRALVTLEAWQRERGGEFLLVTQNIDTLHEKAGSTALVKVHGSADRCRCARRTCRVGARSSIPVEALDFAPFDRDPRVEHIPRCPECHALVRPHVLWFDELYDSHPDYEWRRTMEAAHRMRLLLCVGTSLSVGVTDFLQSAASSRGAPAFLLDPGARPPAAALETVHVRRKAEDVLPEVCDALDHT